MSLHDDLDASNLSGLASLIIRECVGNESAELTSRRICLDLLIPEHVVKFDEPCAKFRQLLYREILNFVFKLLKVTHGLTI